MCAVVSGQSVLRIMSLLGFTIELEYSSMVSLFTGLKLGGSMVLNGNVGFINKCRSSISQESSPGSLG